jgi:hypothetical protein
LRFNSWQGQEIFFFSTVSVLTQRPIQFLFQWESGTLSWGVKWPQCEPDPSPLSSMGLNNFLQTNYYTTVRMLTNEKYHLKCWSGPTLTLQKWKIFRPDYFDLAGYRIKNFKDYWPSNPTICTSVFSRTMSRNRFEVIWQAWHFSDVSTQKTQADFTKFNLLYKVWTVSEIDLKS